VGNLLRVRSQERFQEGAGHGKKWSAIRVEEMFTTLY
jgi:hypothetical protein